MAGHLIRLSNPLKGQGFNDKTSLHYAEPSWDNINIAYIYNKHLINGKKVATIPFPEPFWLSEI